MGLSWYQRDDAGVVEALKRGERPDLATTMHSGPLDELIALHDELGVFDSLDDVPTNRQRRGVEDKLLLRTAAVLPFVESASFSGVTHALFGEPALLLHLGWSPLQICMGDNERYRSPRGKQAESLPCSPETIRDALRRVENDAWLAVQRAGVQALFQHRLVRGHVYAIDGTGLGDKLRLVCLVCVSAERPVIVAWRLLEGKASEKGREATVTRDLIEQARQLGGPDSIELLLVDALYADGPLLAWCKYRCGIDVLVPIPGDRELHRDLEGLAAEGMMKFRHHSYVRTVQGHKQRRTLEIASQAGLTSWDSYMQAAREYGDDAPRLWGAYLRPLAPATDADEPWTLVSTRDWASGVAAFEAFRPRWHIENDAYRELKEGWGLEEERWGRDSAVHRARVTLTCLAFNTAQVHLTRSGGKLAAKGIRRLRQTYQPQLGHSPLAIYLGGKYAVLPVERLLGALGLPVRQSLLPRLRSIPQAQPP
jgi:hypothetical protein